MEPSGNIEAAFVTIGEVSKDLGLTLRTLRFYEDRGLICPMRKNRNRFYGTSDVERIRTITKLKSFGLSLSNIQKLLGSPGEGPYGLTIELCKELVDDLTIRKAEVEAALDQLLHFHQQPLSPSSELAHSA